MPNVISTIVDPAKKVTYRVVAYRQLTREELVLSVRHFLSQKRRHKVKAGDTITIHSILGYDSPLAS
jgi:hypothetical protein